MEYAQLGVWGNIPWKYELNPFSGLGGDVKTNLITKLRRTNELTDGRTNKNFSCYRDHPLRGDLKSWVSYLTLSVREQKKSIELISLLKISTLWPLFTKLKKKFDFQSLTSFFILSQNIPLGMEILQNITSLYERDILG